MPVAKNSPPPIRQVAVLGLGLLATAATVFFLVSQSGELAGPNNITLGDSPEPVFQAGNVSRLADDIASHGPLLLSDLAGGDRDIFLNHVGPDTASGWHAFLVRPPEAPRDCYVQWDPPSSLFKDNCTDTTYPPDGGDLPSLAVSVDAQGNLTIMLDSAT